jgi:hypothetical protein
MVKFLLTLSHKSHDDLSLFQLVPAPAIFAYPKALTEFTLVLNSPALSILRESAARSIVNSAAFLLCCRSGQTPGRAPRDADGSIFSFFA